MSDIRLYIHGRPQGQDLWSAKEDPIDHHYIEPFLDSKVGSDVPCAMIIDIWQKHAYYTYLHKRNVVEKSSRPGAYFAITLRLDGLCRNVSVLFSLLGQVYKKLCVGAIISSEGGQEHFLVSQFREKEAALQQINSVISQNVEKLIIPNMTSLDGSKDTSKASAKAWCLDDIDSPAFLTDCQNYKIVVSEQYRSKDKVHEDDMKRIVPLETECKNLKSSVDQWKSKFGSEEASKIALEKQVDTLKHNIADLQKQMNTIREDVATQFKEKMSALEKDAKERKDDLQKAKNELQKIKDELENQKKKNAKLEKEKAYLEKDLSELQQKLKGNQGEGNGREAGRFQKILGGVVAFDSVLLVVIASFMAFHHFNSYKVPESDIEIPEVIGDTIAKDSISVVDSTKIVNCNATVNGQNEEKNSSNNN